MWGTEDPYRDTNARELYRYGERGILTRYIIAPSDVVDKRRAREGKPLMGNTAYELNRYGFTIGDAVISVCVGVFCAALFLLAIDQLGMAFDRYADLMGW
jgi:hypothetical protein